MEEEEDYLHIRKAQHSPLHRWIGCTAALVAVEEEAVGVVKVVVADSFGILAARLLLMLGVTRGEEKLAAVAFVQKMCPLCQREP